MPDYQSNRFSKKPPFRRSGPPGRDMNGPKKLYSAECSNCHERCEVPFRPNGMKPVFCRNCFNRDDDRAPRDSFKKKEFGGPRESFRPRSAPQEDRRIDDLKRQLTMMEAKIDQLTFLLSASRPVAEKKVVEKKKAAPKKVAAKKK